MKVISASLVRGTAQPGVEVTFRGEGSDNVAIHLKDEGIAAKDDAEIYLRARQVMTQIVAFESGRISALSDLQSIGTTVRTGI